MRLFVGIPLSAETISGLAKLILGLQTEKDGLRWSSSESWHVTLQFLGETTKEQYGCLVPRLQEVVAVPASIRVAGFGLFDRAGVFFADVNFSPELLDLQQSVVNATGRCGFIAEDRPFHPHVTLARAKGDRRKEAMRRLKNRVKVEVRLPAFTATEFLLYEAFLGPGGARYEIRERFPMDSLKL